MCEEGLMTPSLMLLHGVLFLTELRQSFQVACMDLLHLIPPGFQVYTHNSSPEPLVFPGTHCALVMLPGIVTRTLSFNKRKGSL